MIILFTLSLLHIRDHPKKKDLAIIPFKSPMCFFLHYTSMESDEVMPLLCVPITVPSLNKQAAKHRQINHD